MSKVLWEYENLFVIAFITSTYKFVLSDVIIKSTVFVKSSLFTTPMSTPTAKPGEY